MGLLTIVKHESLGHLHHTYCKVSLIDLKSRGKLNIPTVQFVNYLCFLERKFSSLIPCETKLFSVAEFVKSIFEPTDAQDLFYEATYRSDNPEKSDVVQQDILQLYFKIRADHEGRVVTEKN